VPPRTGFPEDETLVAVLVRTGVALALAVPVLVALPVEVAVPVAVPLGAEVAVLGLVVLSLPPQAMRAIPAAIPKPPPTTRLRDSRFRHQLSQ
jgi:hypothetical protein